MTTRALETEEYRQIIKLFVNGFITKNGKIFRPNQKMALCLQLQASLGLRISDVLRLQVNNFKAGKLEIIEQKTDKLQYREINNVVYDFVKDYCIDHKLSQNNKLFCFGIRAMQKQLQIVVEYLGFTHIGTHSFRKMFATIAYTMNNNNLELVKELLNHSSIITTQRYIRVSQEALNTASANMNFII